MEITNKHYWSAVGCKLIETLISVKLWVIVLTSYFAFRLIGLYSEIKDTIISIAVNPDIEMKAVEILGLLTPWSSKLLDITLAMFTGVIVVVTLSREIFKHAKISKEYSNDESKTKDGMI